MATHDGTESDHGATIDHRFVSRLSLMPSEPLPIEAHFAHVQEAYCAHVIVNKPSPEGPVERVSIVFRTRHNSPAAAVDEASGYAETIRLHPDRYHGLFQYVSKLIERERG